jgi:hypothetical protein
MRFWAAIERWFPISTLSTSFILRRFRASATLIFIRRDTRQHFAFLWQMPFSTPPLTLCWWGHFAISIIARDDVTEYWLIICCIFTRSDAARYFKWFMLTLILPFLSSNATATLYSLLITLYQWLPRHYCHRYAALSHSIACLTSCN